MQSKLFIKSSMYRNFNGLNKLKFISPTIKTLSLDVKLLRMPFINTSINRLGLLCGGLYIVQTIYLMPFLKSLKVSTSRIFEQKLKFLIIST